MNLHRGIHNNLRLRHTTACLVLCDAFTMMYIRVHVHVNKQCILIYVTKFIALRKPVSSAG